MCFVSVMLSDSTAKKSLNNKVCDFQILGEIVYITVTTTSIQLAPVFTCVSRHVGLNMYILYELYRCVVLPFNMMHAEMQIGTDNVNLTQCVIYMYAVYVHMCDLHVCSVMFAGGFRVGHNCLPFRCMIHVCNLRKSSCYYDCVCVTVAKIMCCKAAHTIISHTILQ